MALFAAAALNASEPAKPRCCVEITNSAPLTDRSIYQVESRWTSDFGKEIKLDRLRGNPQVLVMFFSSCQFACPVLVHDLKRIEAALPENIRARTGFTLVSFDTERDTVKALHAFRSRMELPDDRWTLLRGSSGDVLELAALLGVKFKKEASGQFAHSNLITLLNAEGEIVLQVSGLQQDLRPAVEAIIRFARKDR